jgi:CDP-glycerol glycerophosphotransferase (TagB/SpsB family)
VAVTFHSEQPSGLTCPEAHTAWEHYRQQMPDIVADLRARGWTVLGHGHPRLWRKIGPWWRKLGVEAVQSFDEILARADVLCFDNTSAGPEFASTGRPVVFVNSPDWRRDVWHGGRFWDWPRGQISVDGAAGLADAVDMAWADHPSVAAARQRMVDQIYVACDGHAAERAADAILAVAATRV